MAVPRFVQFLGIYLSASMMLLCAADKPNVLFLVADDLNCSLGAYGDPTAITPNLDRLAERSLVFERAYCQQAVCNPSRASFLTGLRPKTTGVNDLRKYFRDTAPNGKKLLTLPGFFKSQGYFTQDIGKIFHNMGDTADRQSWSMDEILYNGPHSSDTLFFNAPEDPEHPKPDYKSPVTENVDVPDTAYRDGQIAELASAVLDDFAGSGKPFFLAVGFWRPHLPFVAPKKYWDLYDSEAIPAPAASEPPSGAPEIALHGSREIRNYGLVTKEGPFSAKEIRHYRHGYYASISFLDAQVGKILDALEEAGLADDTIVVFTSDHGFHIGEHGLWGKTSNYELDARVPLIIHAPGEGYDTSRGGKSSSLAELVDLYPTLSDLAGLQTGLPGNLEGVSLKPVLENPDTIVKEAAFTRHQQPFYGSPKNWKSWGYSMRTPDWRYTEWHGIGDEEDSSVELYDHRTDPNETKNVAIEHPDVISKLSPKLQEHFGVFFEP